MAADRSTTLEELKRAVREAVDARADALLAISHEIHAHPELSFEEHRASELLVAKLREAGLEVKAPCYGLETAFCSDFGRDGPRVALLAEYDALPEIGHACGHNLIATAAVGAGLALRSLGERLPGRVRLLGTPAEERGGGKELMAREGAFEDVAAAMMIHPAGLNLVDMPSIAVSEVEVRYRGQAAHAAAAPERGVNALDALVIAYQALAALRQHIRRTERIHGIITEGGRAPNVVPDRAAGRFYVRAANAKELEALKQRVIACFRAGAEATGASLELAWGRVDYRAIRFNAPLAQHFRHNAERLGRRFTPIEEVAGRFAASTDLGNVSHRVPAIHPMLAAAPPDCAIHDAAFAEHAGAPIGDAAALDGAKALAMTALDYLADRELREQARAAFEAHEE